MATFDQLAVRLNRLALRSERGIERFVATIGTEIGRVIVPATPVDTGFARANWRPALNAPAATTTSALDPSGAATVARITVVSRQYRLGFALFLTNRTPYIGSLNAGSSGQAPAGFVQASVRRGVNIARASFPGIFVGVRSF